MKKAVLLTLPAISALVLSSCGIQDNDADDVVSSSGSDTTASVNSGALANATKIAIKKEYTAPNGKDSLEANIYTENGKIVHAEVTNPHGYVKSFGSALASAVVGKELHGLKIDTIGGASLTTTAFNEAISAY